MKIDSHLGTVLVFGIVVFVLWQGFEAIQPDFSVIGWIAFGSAALFIPAMFATKIAIMWSFHAFDLKPGTKRVSRPRAPKEV